MIEVVGMLLRLLLIVSLACTVTTHVSAAPTKAPTSSSSTPVADSATPAPQAPQRRIHYPSTPRAEPEAAPASTPVRSAPPAERPKRLRYRRGEPTPEGYVLRESTRKGLWITGAVIFSVAYMVAFSIAEDGQDANAAIPVVGPLLASRSDARNNLAAVDAVAQGVGLSMFVLGLTLKKKNYVREDLAGWTLAPMRVSSGAGAQLMAQF